jgi:hypothetical protein
VAALTSEVKLVRLLVVRLHRSKGDLLGLDGFTFCARAIPAPDPSVVTMPARAVIVGIDLSVPTAVAAHDALGVRGGTVAVFGELKARHFAPPTNPDTAMNETNKNANAMLDLQFRIKPSLCIRPGL